MLFVFDINILHFVSIQFVFQLIGRRMATQYMDGITLSQQKWFCFSFVKPVAWL